MKYKRVKKLIAAVATSVTGVGIMVGTDLTAVGGAVATVGNAWAVFWFKNEPPE